MKKTIAAATLVFASACGGDITSSDPQPWNLRENNTGVVPETDMQNSVGTCSERYNCVLDCVALCTMYDDECLNSCLYETNQRCTEVVNATEDSNCCEELEECYSLSNNKGHKEFCMSMIPISNEGEDACCVNEDVCKSRWDFEKDQPISGEDLQICRDYYDVSEFCY